MSVFSPVDPRLGNERRKQLMAKLAAQMMGSNNAYAAQAGLGPLRGGAGYGGGTAFHSGTANRPQASPFSTQGLPSLPQALRDLLGPGGVGRGMPTEHSPRPGLPFDPNLTPGGGPPITPLTPSGPANPMPTTPSLPGPVGGPNGGGPGAAGPVGIMSLPSPAPSAQPNPVGLQPLGNGLFYDPATDTVHVLGGAPAQTGSSILRQ